MQALGQPPGASRAFARSRFPLLTRRGMLLLFGGVAICVTALVLNQRDLLRVGVALTVVALAAWVYLAFRSRRFSVSRQVSPGRCLAGDTVAVSLAITRPHSGPPLKVTDELPTALGGSRQLVIASVSRGTSHHTYHVSASRRGAWKIGPFTSTMTDSFRIVQHRWRSEAFARLVVMPQIYPVKVALPSGSSFGSHDGTAHGLALSGAADITVREYRAGDDMRRVHWRSTARRGEIMVRNTIHSSASTALLIVDTDDPSFSHGSESSFEWMVSAAASVVQHLNELDWDIRLSIDGKTELIEPGSVDAMANAMEYFACLTPGSAGTFASSVAVALENPLPSHVLVITGNPHEASHPALSALMQAHTRGTILSVAPAGNNDSGGLPSPLSGATGWDYHRTSTQVSVTEAFEQLAAAGRQRGGVS